MEPLKLPSDSTPETDERIMSLCEDPVYFESMKDSCTCILGAGEIRKGIDALTEAHEKDVLTNARITGDNKTKTTALDAEMSRYRTQLDKTAYWTRCDMSEDAVTATCKNAGFDHTVTEANDWSLHSDKYDMSLPGSRMDNDHDVREYLWNIYRGGESPLW